MYGTTLGLMLLVPAAPVPPPPPDSAATPAPAPADRAQARAFARLVHDAALNVSSLAARPGEQEKMVTELLAAAVRGLYEEAGQTPPDDLLQIVRRGQTVSDRQAGLADARLQLGRIPALAGPRAYFAAVNGFKHAIDASSGITPTRMNNYVSIDMDFGVGIELDGVTGSRWSIYRVERALATGYFPVQGILGPVPKLEDLPSPAAFPWRVKRVIPGGPAHRAGVKAGDLVTRLNGIEVTPERAGKLFTDFAFPSSQAIDPRSGIPVAAKWRLTLRRAGKPDPIDVTLETEGYTPETVHGVIRTAEGRWDCMLDRELRIGYVRVGPVEEKSDEHLAELIQALEVRKCRAIILDLRWCPGGYVIPGCGIAGLFLREGLTIASLDIRNPAGRLGATVYRSGQLPLKVKPVCLDTPLLVLVGSETTGGGELIAAALQDHGRCEVMGQRTVGRAGIQNTIPIGWGDLQFKVTTGTTLRPNGKNRQRNPDSQPTDEWGVRPDPGLEVPVTPDVSAQLRRWADEHAARPAGSDESLDFDDPARDPFRTAALAYLRKKLAQLQ